MEDIANISQHIGQLLAYKEKNKTNKCKECQDLVLELWISVNNV